MGNLVVKDDFKIWVKEISIKYKQTQIKASISVNREMILFYFELGKEISINSFKSVYGSHFYSNLSKELIFNLQNVSGLSPINLRYMERFYNLYKDVVIKVPQLVEQLSYIPWGHHRLIIDKCKDVQKAIFFIKKIIENNWSRDTLLNFLDTDLYIREKNTINNFDNVLPEEEKELAKQLSKDPYCFDFLSISFNYSEKELKMALLNNIEKFLLELGNGFAFVGKEKRLDVGNSEIFTDLLFYNINLHAYVVIEVKISKFRPQDLGQLGLYVSCVNHKLKGEKDNPTLGILICKDKDEVIAKYSLENYNIPLGISTYDINNILQNDLKNTLSSIEKLKQHLID